MTRLLFWLALLVCLTVPAASQLLLGVSMSNSGGGTPVANCDGTIDLSTGCVQPMIGGV